jgi:leader peptidase (prepilin peptidase)/N-methyltransferase
VETVIAFSALGAGFGVLAQWLLCRARRPAPVSAWACVAGTGLLWALAAGRWLAGAWPGWWLPVPLVAGALAVPLALADLRHRRLPDVLTLPAIPVAGLAVVVVALAGPGTELALRAVAAALAFGGAHALLRVVAPAALGAGDVKLAYGLGGLLGAAGWAALPVSAVSAAVGTVVLAAVRRARGEGRHGVPHGPGLLAATVLVTFFPGPGSEVGMGS